MARRGHLFDTLPELHSCAWPVTYPKMKNSSRLQTTPRLGFGPVADLTASEQASSFPPSSSSALRLQAICGGTKQQIPGESHRSRGENSEGCERSGDSLLGEEPWWTHLYRISVLRSESTSFAHLSHYALGSLSEDVRLMRYSAPFCSEMKVLGQEKPPRWPSWDIRLEGDHIPKQRRVARERAEPAEAGASRALDAGASGQEKLTCNAAEPNVVQS